MIMDELLQFADNVSCANTAGTDLIGDVIDLGAVPQDFGHGKPMYLVIMPSVEIITAGAAGLIQFKLASDSAAAIATDGSATDHILTEVFVTDGVDANDAQLKIGGQIFMGALPLGGGVPYERYLGILAIVTTTEVTVGSIHAFLTMDPSLWKAYADGVN